MTAVIGNGTYSQGAWNSLTTIACDNNSTCSDVRSLPAPPSTYEMHTDNSYYVCRDISNISWHNSLVSITSPVCLHDTDCTRFGGGGHLTCTTNSGDNINLTCNVPDDCDGTNDGSTPYCVNGICKAACGCNLNADCGAGYCTNSKCVSVGSACFYCTNSSQCDDGYVCDTITNSNTYGLCTIPSSIVVNVQWFQWEKLRWILLIIFLVFYIFKL